MHEATTEICKNHECVSVEALKLKNMTQSAQGSMDKPGTNVKAKAGLNCALLLRGLGEAAYLIEHKQKLSGGLLIKVPAQYTSQSCAVCGHVSRNSRREHQKGRTCPDSRDCSLFEELSPGTCRRAA